jgi:hypothetical protein
MAALNPLEVKTVTVLVASYLALVFSELVHFL